MQSVDDFLSETPAPSSADSSSSSLRSVDDFLTTPKSVLTAQEKLGSQDSNGLCEQFVEQHVFGKTGMFPTAIDAASHYSQNGQLDPDLEKAPAGAMVYFNADPSNGGAGHVAIADGRGNIIGATDNGVQRMSLHKWISLTNQQPLGFVAPQ